MVLFSCFFPLCFLIRNDDILCFALLHHSMFMLCICYGANNFLTIIILFLRFQLLLLLLPAHNSLLNIKFNILFFFYSCYTRVLASSSYTYFLSYIQNFHIFPIKLLCYDHGLLLHIFSHSQLNRQMKRTKGKERKISHSSHITKRDFIHWKII